jgi:hypothetical protein|tara:strand:- start:969 stop:2159 length:1191 start_codon:yes stop_codon:yes gene_type:complete
MIEKQLLWFTNTAENMEVFLDERAVQIQERLKVDDVATCIYLYRKFMSPAADPFEKVSSWLRDTQNFLKSYLECDSPKVMIDVDNVPQSPRVLAKKLGEILDVSIGESLQITESETNDLWSIVYDQFLRATPTSGRILDQIDESIALKTQDERREIQIARHALELLLENFGRDFRTLSTENLEAAYNDLTCDMDKLSRELEMVSMLATQYQVSLESNEKRMSVNQSRARMQSVLPRSPHITQLVSQNIFDRQYYLQQGGSRLFSRQHYEMVGWKKLIKPHPLFDPDFYLLEAGLGNITLRTSPLQHYIDYGSRVNIDTHAIFDSQWYLATNPDVLESGLPAIVHFILYGASEGRWPNETFDPLWYLDNYPDVSESGLNPLVHFVLYGQNEERRTKG